VPRVLELPVIRTLRLQRLREDLLYRIALNRLRVTPEMTYRDAAIYEMVMREKHEMFAVLERLRLNS
jgi:hypothetical protein